MILRGTLQRFVKLVSSKQLNVLCCILLRGMELGTHIHGSSDHPDLHLESFSATCWQTAASFSKPVIAVGFFKGKNWLPALSALGSLTLSQQCSLQNIKTEEIPLNTSNVQTTCLTLLPPGVLCVYALLFKYSYIPVI